MNVPSETTLPVRVQEILCEVARRMGAPGSALLQQAVVATTTQVTPTWIDIRVPGGVAKGPWPDGALSTSPTVLTPDGEPLGTIHVWTERGVLAAIEQGWITDTPPDEWPTTAQLQWP